MCKHGEIQERRILYRIVMPIVTYSDSNPGVSAPQAFKVNYHLPICITTSAQLTQIATPATVRLLPLLADAGSLTARPETCVQSIADGRCGSIAGPSR